jgi:transcriptional regulator with XRE-family HTH domain
VREQRSLTLEQLSTRTAELGHPFADSAINKIERGVRDASIGDVVALAAALDISPAHLLFPTTIDSEDTKVRLGKDGDREETVLRLRDWFSGRAPLGDSDAFYSMTPERDQKQRNVARHPLMMKLVELEVYARDFARIGTGLETEVRDEKVLWHGIVRVLGDVITLLNMTARDAGLEEIDRLVIDDKPAPTKRSKS